MSESNVASRRLFVWFGVRSCRRGSSAVPPDPSEGPCVFSYSPVGAQPPFFWRSTRTSDRSIRLSC